MTIGGRHDELLILSTCIEGAEHHGAHNLLRFMHNEGPAATLELPGQCAQQHVGYAQAHVCKSDLPCSKGLLDDEGLTVHIRDP